MEILLFVIAAVSSYLICGVNPAIVLSKLIYRQDIRTLGSKNPGFTNFKRVFGSRYAWYVFLLDIVKSLLPCLLFGWMFGHFYGIRQLGVAYTCLFAMLGHAYPVWYRFRGGKAFLVWIAALYMVDWRAGLIATGVFLFFLFVVQYMSLASILAAVTGPVALAFLGYSSIWVLVLCIASSLFMIYRHKANIVRLIRRKEKKFSLFGKLKKKKQPVEPKPEEVQEKDEITTAP